MAPDGRPARPFQQAAYELATAPRRLTLEPIRAGEADALGAAFAAIDPWAAYGMTPARLGGFFAKEDVDCRRWSIRSDGRLVGAVVVTFPWLHGPYLQFLGLMPGHQGSGAGAAVLDWMEREAGPATRNLWLCVSGINTRARAFYERHGYRHAATLDALVADGMDELLMRKRLAPVAEPQSPSLTGRAVP